jgi:hypothetical protein
VGALVDWDVGALVDWNVGTLVDWDVGALVNWDIGLMDIGSADFVNFLLFFRGTFKLLKTRPTGFKSSII